MDFLSVESMAALIGLAGGIALGLAARLGQFCTLGALESAFYGDSQRRLRMWGVTLAVAIFGTFLLVELGLLDLSNTLYRALEWNPLASIAGGLIFGIGMAYAGNCGFGALARIGGGDLRALVVVIVMAIFSYMTIGGPFARLREFLFPSVPAENQSGIAELIGSIVHVPTFAIASIIALGFLAWALMYPELRRSKSAIFWSAVVGLAVISGWWGTSLVAVESFDTVAVQTHTFTAPLGRTLIYMMTSSAGGLGFPVGSVVGVILGGLFGSMIKGHFRWEACEDARELGRQMLGAALMGVGGVTALGCSIGQGVSAFSTLAYSAPVTLAAIAVGGLIGLRILISGFEPD